MKIKVIEKIWNPEIHSEGIIPRLRTPVIDSSEEKDLVFLTHSLPPTPLHWQVVGNVSITRTIKVVNTEQIPWTI